MDSSSGHLRSVAPPASLPSQAQAPAPAGHGGVADGGSDGVGAGAGPADHDSNASLDADAAPMTTAHLARFEFSEHGTKILMVEWHPGAADSVTGQGSGAGVDRPPPPHSTAAVPGPDAGPASVLDPDPADDSAAWEISWPGKSTVLPATESDRDQDGARRRRVYFLLPTDASIPAEVTVAGPGGRPRLLLQPLPAIFPEGFDFEAGPRGVLHTIWAKKRLSELDREMDAELRTNAESVGLEMARAERQWIIDNFLPPPPPSPAQKGDPASPRSPRSPGAGRLSDKLKGLRLGTSPAELVPSPTANTFTSVGAQSLTLSPTGGDVAVSSFPVRPPNTTSTAPMSLNAAMHGDVPSTTAAPSDSLDTEDDLFALPISPRSPDMKKSPFSIL
ncbi:hypothetical protein HJFPF1_01432 [Paramyrothecium foliicola]|nr:hypothetical protein HJFPF1_01432 [Paramyrothecium foliicola]